MAEFDEGISAEEAGIDEGAFGDEGTGVDEGVGVADEGDAGVGTEDNPWAWVDERGVTPDVVRDSFENFTKKTQALSEKEASLKPYEELMGELQSDAGLQNLIREYFASGATPEKEVANLAQELRTMQTQLAVDSEFKELRDYVAKNDLPAFKEDDVLKYAVDEGMPTMAAAYKAMSFEDARASARQALENDIKKGKSAAVPKSGRGDGAATGRPSAADIANMSEEDFVSGYDSIIKGIVG